MEINFEKVGFRYKRLIRKIYKCALNLTGNDNVNVVIGISFAKEESIRELNRKHRNINLVTDVLSFPMLDIQYPEKVISYVDEIAYYSGLYLGDVVICKTRAKQQAKEYGHSIKREIGFLALHGLLHVLGYDHIEKDDEKIMKETTDKILNDIGLLRGKNV